MLIPNLRLRAARERCGMSRGRLAEDVALWLARRDPKGRDVAFDANHLGKIERGAVGRPRDHYVAALCAILQSTEQELGFDHESRATPGDVDRKLFLQTALGVGAGALVGRGELGGTDLLAAIVGPTAHYRRIADAVSPAELTPAVEAHLRLASSVVRNVLPTRDGFAALGEAAILAAWVARQRDDLGTARRHYASAASCAERAKNPLLTTLMLVSRGHFAVEEGEPTRGLELYRQARAELVRAAAPDAAHGWLAAFHADAYAVMADRAAAYAQLRKAESRSGEPSWPWVLNFEDAVAEYRARTLDKLGDLAAARDALAAVRVDRLQPRQLAMAQADHANALARAGELDVARALAGEAFVTAQRYGFERIIRRIGELAPAKLV